MPPGGSVLANVTIDLDRASHSSMVLYFTQYPRLESPSLGLASIRQESWLGYRFFAFSLTAVFLLL